MVKIPSFDELKKMGSGLIDSAKTVKFGEMVDKLKSGIDSVSSKKPPAVGDEALANVFKEIYASLNSMTEAQAAQVNAVKKMEAKLEELAQIVEQYKPPVTPVAPPELKPEVEPNQPEAEPKPEEKKTHE